jgi:transcription-repair coupling factor (superfamily II helicase)
VETVYVRKLAGKCGFNLIKQKGNMVLLYFKGKTAMPLHLLSQLMQEHKGRLMFSAGKTPYLSYKVQGLTPRQILENIKILLQCIHKLQTG